MTLPVKTRRDNLSNIYQMLGLKENKQIPPGIAFKH
jgi:hypothetical protein